MLKTCKHNHPPHNKKHCPVCRYITKKKWKDNNPDKVKAWREKNKEKDKIWSNSWRDKNPELNRENNRKWRTKNKDKECATSSKHRAKRLLRYPKWLTKEQEKEIKNVYKKAKQMEKETGIKYHVDHIVPLNGENVSGLHVPWNLQILEASENIKKGNRLK